MAALSDARALDLLQRLLSAPCTLPDPSLSEPQG